MTKTFKILRNGAITLTVVTTLAGCNGSFAGGGTLATGSSTPAMARFRLECSPSTQAVSGFLSYTDPTARVSLYSGALRSTRGLGSIGLPPDLYRAAVAQLEDMPVGSLPGMIPINGCDSDTREAHYGGTYGSPGVTATTETGRTVTYGANLGTFTFDLQASSRCPSGFTADIAFVGGRFSGYHNGGCLDGRVNPLAIP